jgi:hypothetical protein
LRIVVPLTQVSITSIKEMAMASGTWSTPKEVVRLEVGIAIEEDCNGEEEAQAGRDRCEVAAG